MTASCPRPSFPGLPPHISCPSATSLAVAELLSPIPGVGWGGHAVLAVLSLMCPILCPQVPGDGRDAGEDPRASAGVHEARRHAL